MPPKTTGLRKPGEPGGYPQALSEWRRGWGAVGHEAGQALCCTSGSCLNSGSEAGEFQAEEGCVWEGRARALSHVGRVPGLQSRSWEKGQWSRVRCGFYKKTRSKLSLEGGTATSSGRAAGVGAWGEPKDSAQGSGV